MSIPEIFRNLKLDTWYKAFVYIGGITFFASLFFDVKGITNSQLQLLAGGIFLIGIGEWKNHKKLSQIKPPNAYTGPAALVTWTERMPDFIGNIFIILGLVLIGYGIYQIVIS